MMIRNYVTAALRTLRRQKAYSLINVAGFSIGIACVILMLLYARDEFTFDAFHAGAGRIYRMVETNTSPTGAEKSGFTRGPLGPALKSSRPDVEAVARVRDASGTGRFTVGREPRRFYEGSFLIAEQSFLEIFDFPLLSGDRATALTRPGTVLLTEAAAVKYFGGDDPVGKPLFAEDFDDVLVTGVMADPPSNSHLQFSMIFSFATLEARPGWKKFIDEWDSDGFLTYVMLRPGADPAEVDSAIAGIARAKFVQDAGTSSSVRLQPLADIHFGSEDIQFERNSGEQGLAPVTIFATVALMVLAMACINYVNLATARALRRSREIGMRKVAGAGRSHLMAQFLGESSLLALAGAVIAVVIAEAALPSFNAMSGKTLNLDLTGDALSLPSLLLVTALVGVASGVYPALVLAGMSPAMILRNQRPTGRRGVVLRKALVGVQFALSVAMIAGTLVAQNQLEYIRTKDLGFDRERLVVIDINSGETRRGFETIKSQMLGIPDVKSVSVSSRVPGDWKNIETVDVRVPAGGTREMSYIGIDEDFLATFKIGLAGGRNISGQATVDTACVLLNRAAAAMLGWDDPVGREIEVKNPPVRLRVVGLVGDFHFASLHEPVGPLVLGHRLNPIDRIDYFTARLAAGSGPGVIADLAAIHETFDTSTPFEHNVLDDRIGDFYAADRLTGDIFAIAAGLAIAIACLGLLGLISYTTDLRTKEIGIRKVLGASSSDILTLLSKDIAVPAVVAAAVASPVAWLAIESWLGDFAYRIDVGPGTFLVAAVSAGVIAAGTVSFHALRAAQRNPVDTIRYE